MIFGNNLRIFKILFHFRSIQRRGGGTSHLSPYQENVGLRFPQLTITPFEEKQFGFSPIYVIIIV
jgi:hypothetical protein